jgi:hypothetical protein
LCSHRLVYRACDYLALSCWCLWELLMKSFLVAMHVIRADYRLLGNLQTVFWCFVLISLFFVYFEVSASCSDWFSFNFSSISSEGKFADAQSSVLLRPLRQ